MWMFGDYDFPAHIEQEGLSISVQKREAHLVYTRVCLGEKVEKTLLVNDGKVLLNPVEPVNRPKPLTTYLLLSLEKVLVLAPKTARKIFLKFPVEIGVFLSNNRDLQVLDVFTLTSPKFTLYGDPRNGVLCRHWKSDIYFSPPPVDPFREGVMALAVENNSPDWVEITKAVFNAYGMKLFYNDRMVAMKGVMGIRSGGLAETDFQNAPLEEGMKNAVEIYAVRKLSITSREFVMEFGL